MLFLVGLGFTYPSPFHFYFPPPPQFYFLNFFIPSSFLNSLLLHNINLSPPRLLSFFLFSFTIFIIFPRPPPPPHLVYICFPSTNTSTLHRPHIDPSSPHQPHIDSTSTLHRPHIDFYCFPSSFTSSSFLMFSLEKA